MRPLLEERRAREVLDDLVEDAHRLVARSIMLAPPPGGQAWARVAGLPDADAWLIVWAPGSATRLHDDRWPCGIVRVLRGSLVERQSADRRTRSRRLRAGTTSRIGSGLDHEMRNAGRDEAVSLHVCASRSAYADLSAISSRVPIG